jgi:DNA primase large subunit
LWDNASKIRSKIKDREALSKRIEALNKQTNYEVDPLMEKREYQRLTNAINEELFPPCMKLLLKGAKEDGRKRSIFILINFLRKMGWEFNDIERRLLDWNKLNYEPLREEYIKSVVNRSKGQKEEILPPNCDNPNYYKGMAVCQPDFFCRGIKNPIQNVGRKLKK